MSAAERREGASPPGPAQPGRPGDSARAAGAAPGAHGAGGNTTLSNTTTPDIAGMGGGVAGGSPPRVRADAGDHREPVGPGSSKLGAAGGEASGSSSAGRVLTTRVDTLYLHADVDVRRDVFDALRDARASARASKVERLPWRLGGQDFALEVSGGRRGAYLLRNADCAVLIGFLAPTVQVQFGAMACATHTIAELAAIAEAIAADVGYVERVTVGRLDLCADLVKVPFQDGDVRSMVTRSRSQAEYLSLRGLGEWQDDSGQWWRKTGEPLFTGFAVSLGSPVALRVYLKTEELRAMQDPGSDKVAVEHARWTAAGWDGAEPVWRVEYELRDLALTELELRAVAQLEEKLDSAWQYLTRQWMRLVELDGSTRRERCPTDPRWEVVQGAVFRHAHVPPAVRRRKQRGGASRAQAVGGIVSWASGSDIFEDFNPRRGVTTQEETIAALSRAMAIAAADAIEAEGLGRVLEKIAATKTRLAKVRAVVVDAAVA